MNRIKKLATILLSLILTGLFLFAPRSYQSQKRDRMVEEMFELGLIESQDRSYNGIYESKDSTNAIVTLTAQVRESNSGSVEKLMIDMIKKKAEAMNIVLPDGFEHDIMIYEIRKKDSPQQNAEG